MRRNYHRKLLGEIIKGNYEEKLSQEIIRRNYHRKLSANIYHHAKNVGIIGILPYPKIKSKRKRGNRRAPLPLKGNRMRTAYIMWGNHQGKGWLKLKFRSLAVWQFQSFFVSCRRTYVLKNICLCNQVICILYTKIYRQVIIE